MKKLLKVLGIASIFAAVLGFGFVACDNGGGSSGSGNGDGGGSGDPSATVNAVWDFSNDTADASNNVAEGTVLTPDSGEGATLKGAGGADIKIKDVDGTVCLAVGKNGKAISDYAAQFKGKLTLTLANKADVVMNCCASGSTELNNRWYVITSGDEEIAKADFQNDATATTRRDVKFEDVPAGTYTIWMNGFRIYSLSCSNQSFKVDTKTVANTEENFGIVGDAVAVDPADVVDVTFDDGKANVVITSKETGAGKSATVKVTKTGSTSYALISVSVALNGSITVGDIEKVSFSSEEKDLDAIKAALSGKLHPRFGTIIGVTLNGTSDAITVEGNKITSVAEGSGTVTVSDGKNSQDVTVTVSGAGEISFAAGAAPFIADTKTVANDEGTLGVVATAGKVSVTEGSDVASASVESDGIKITSLKEGTAKISAGDDTNAATITVTVNAKGDVATSVEKYVDPATVFPNVAASVTLTVTEAKTVAIGTSTLSVDDALSCVGCKVTETLNYGGGNSNWKSEGGKIYAKISSDAGYLQIKPLIGSFAAGDVLTFDCYLDKSSNTDDKTFICWKATDTTAPSGTKAETKTTAGAYTGIKLTLTDDDILSDGSIKIGRSKSAYFYSVTITRPEPQS